MRSKIQQQRHAPILLFNRTKKIQMKNTLSVILFVFASLHMQAQYPQVSIPGSEVRTITSAKVPGQQYKLEILLPSGYANSTKKYPVVYLMDSQWDFTLVKSIYGEYYYDGFIPELIIVGVTWGGERPNPDSLRARDYTPTNDRRLIQSGGADKFLSFMKEELFPFIETNYRAKADDRVLMGCSLGGLFTIYAMFTHTDMFRGYAAASPAIGWDDDVLKKYEKQFATKSITNPIRLYMTVGDVERNKRGFEKMATFLSQQHYTNVSISHKVLENTGHSGTKGETYSRGLQFIFQRQANKLSDEELTRFTGKYKNAGGYIVEIKKENGQLVLAVSPTNTFSLYNSDENEFYSNSQLLNIHFKIKDKKMEGFELEQFGGSDFFSKVN